MQKLASKSRTAHRAATVRSVQYGEALAQLASASGGSWFHNSNDFEGGLRSLIAVPEYRYLLQFAPDTRQDGTFHHLQIKVARKRTHVIARAGYFAETEAPASNERSPRRDAR
ncbi:MAG TPA: hypothetical protein VKX25_12980 [Bryobacteraceae bacterium]|jgi:VWFA-related protein|nr:hypothetical protein [Bryobacteraceae bacterium]